MRYPRLRLTVFRRANLYDGCAEKPLVDRRYRKPTQNKFVMTDPSESPQRRMSPMVRFLGSVVLSAILIGGYSFGVYNAAIERGAVLAIGAGLLASPFAMVGLVMLWSACVNFLMLFNPRAVLTINNSTIRPGRTLQMRWEIEGDSHRIQSLEISLIGIEKDEMIKQEPIENDRGFKDFLHELKIFSTTSPEQIKRGQASWKVPKDIKLSTGTSPMEWKIRLRGTIASWPDVYDEVEIRIVDHI